MSVLTPTVDLQEILARAAVDRDFRSGLLTDPRGTIEAAYAEQLPADLRIRFVEKDPDLDAMHVLPDSVSQSSALTPEERAAVQGGHSWAWKPPAGPSPV